MRLTIAAAVAVVWVLGLGFALALGKAAARGDRLREEAWNETK